MPNITDQWSRIFVVIVFALLMVAIWARVSYGRSEWPATNVVMGSGNTLQEDTDSGEIAQIPECTVTTLGVSCGISSAGNLATVSNGFTAAFNCTTPGSDLTTCQFDGAFWVPLIPSGISLQSLAQASLPTGNMTNTVIAVADTFQLPDEPTYTLGSLNSSVWVFTGTGPEICYTGPGQTFDITITATVVRTTGTGNTTIAIGIAAGATPLVDGDVITESINSEEIRNALEPVSVVLSGLLTVTTGCIGPMITSEATETLRMTGYSMKAIEIFPAP